MLLIERLLKAPPRRVVLAQGASVPRDLRERLLGALRCAQWERKERKLRSDEYITLRKLKPCDPATASTRRKRAEKRFQKHVALWDASAAIVEALCPDFEWTTLAITRNFRGSPHRDRLDTRYQLAISLGDFKDGEGFCVLNLRMDAS